MAESENNRLAAFSDGVIAVAITLLVLDIHLPEGFGKFTDAQLIDALVALRSRFFAYLLSFLVIAVYWMNHHSKMRHIIKTNRGLIWINMLFLLSIGLVPFTTDLIAENSGTVATIIYAAGMIICGLSLTWLWIYADRHGLTEPGLSADEKQRLAYTTLFSSAVFAISVPISFIYADAAKYFWLLILPVNMLVRVTMRLLGGRKSG